MANAFHFNISLMLNLVVLHSFQCDLFKFCLVAHVLPFLICILFFSFRICRMVQTRLACKRPAGDSLRDPGGVPLGNLREDPAVALDEGLEMDQTPARPRKRSKKLRNTKDPHLVDEIKAGKVVALSLSCIASQHSSPPIIGLTIMMLLNFSLCLLLGCEWDG